MMNDHDKQWQLLEKITMSSVIESRRARRWSIFFKLMTFGYLAIALYLVFFWKSEGDASLRNSAHEHHVAVIEIKGVIADGFDVDANRIIAALQKAYKNKYVKAVILDISSPGGSPVQAGYVADEIQRLRSLNPDKKTYAVIADLGASAAYYIASSADEVWADKASLVGSIGVISSGFGFVDALMKLGVERRVITAGDNKAFMDPFQPLRETHKQFWEQSLNRVHQQFIDQVKRGRGDRLQHHEDLFSGLIWAGETALAMGLVDGLGSMDHVARERIGVDTRIDYTVSPDPLDRFLERFSSQFIKQAVNYFNASNTMQVR